MSDINAFNKGYKTFTNILVKKKCYLCLLKRLNLSDEAHEKVYNEAKIEAFKAGFKVAYKADYKKSEDIFNKECEDKFEEEFQIMSDDPTYSKYKLSLTHYLETAIGIINYENPHRLRWTDEYSSDSLTFPNYKAACIYIRDILDTTNTYTNTFSDSLKWKLTDLKTWEVINYDDNRNDQNDDDDYFYDEDEYQRDFDDAIDKVLYSKAFRRGLGLKLSMRTS
jgi:hypothetical protein